MPSRGFGKIAVGRARRGRGGLHAYASRGVVNDNDSDDEPAFIDGRHFDVAEAGAHAQVSHLCLGYRQLSGQSLLALCIGVCQQHITELSSITVHSRSERELLSADRVAIDAVERYEHRTRAVHLARLTNTINHLVALEHTMALHVAASTADMQGQGARLDPVCDGCGCTAAESSALGSGAARRR